MAEIDTRKIVLERADILLDQARKNAKTNENRAVRYVKLARRLLSRYRLGTPERFKKSFCKVCNRAWIPGYNVQIRINRRTKTVEYLCLCKNVRRFGYRARKQRR